MAIEHVQKAVVDDIRIVYLRFKRRPVTPGNIIVVAVQPPSIIRWVSDAVGNTWLQEKDIWWTRLHGWAPGVTVHVDGDEMPYAGEFRGVADVTRLYPTTGVSHE